MTEMVNETLDNIIKYYCSHSAYIPLRHTLLASTKSQKLELLP
jgi:hypothetical protein